MMQDRAVDSAEGGKYISFVAGGVEFCVDIRSVHSVIRVPPISRVPRTPEFVEGVVELLGAVVPVLDIRKRFGFPLTPIGNTSRIIVTELKEGKAGFLVDSVGEIMRIGGGDLLEPPRMIAGIDEAYIEKIGRVGEKLLIILNLSRVLSEDEKTKLAER